MEIVMVFTAGLLISSGIYSMLSNSLVRIIIGIMLLSHGANLMVFMTGGLKKTQPAFIHKGFEQLQASAADPIPQALVLTAIVIGFGMTAFVLILFHRSAVAIKDNELKTIAEGNKI